MRVLRLLNMRAMVLPVRALTMVFGTEPDFSEVLCEEEVRIRDVSSDGVRSLMERRCRGAKGKVWGMVEVLYLQRRGRALVGRRGGMVGTVEVVSQGS